MLKLAPKTPSNDVSGFLNEFFDDWYEKDVAGQRLPFRYNWRPRPGERDLNAVWPDDAFPARLRRLYLDRAGLAALPDEICGQFCNLVCLRARGNQLKALPADIVQLTKLEELDVRDNLLKQIPAALAALPLKALRLCGNPLT